MDIQGDTSETLHRRNQGKRVSSEDVRESDKYTCLVDFRKRMINGEKIRVFPDLSLQ